MNQRFHSDHDPCRVIVVLEGGYNLLNVGSGCAAIARVLLESASISMDECSVFEQGADVRTGTILAISETIRHHARSWPILAASEGGYALAEKHPTGCS